MYETMDVNTGDVAVNGRASILRAVAIGSCVVVAAYDPKTSVAGMAHIMLPDQAPAKANKSTKYAFDSIEKLFILMAGLGAQVEDVEVCLVGAGNVLRKEDDTICGNNIISVMSILSERGVPIRASILGGFLRKSIFMETHTGCVSYTEGEGPKTFLWQPAREVAANDSK